MDAAFFKAYLNLSLKYIFFSISGCTDEEIYCESYYGGSICAARCDDYIECADESDEGQQCKKKI